MRILGIDPGLRTTGFGVLEKHGNKLAYVASGTIRSNGETSLPERLKTLYDGISEVARTYAPDCAAIEKVFVNDWRHFDYDPIFGRLFLSSVGICLVE